MPNLIQGAWLTVNRKCNLRCRWCYAEAPADKHEEDMTFGLAESLVGFLARLGVGQVIVLGGEPLLWQYLSDLSQVAEVNNLKTVLVTNGIMFSRLPVVEMVKRSKFHAIDLSVKADSDAAYKEITGVKAYSRLVRGMRNLSRENVDFTASITVNRLNAHCIAEMVKMAVENGARRVTLQFCAATMDDFRFSSKYMLEPFVAAQSVVEAYNKLRPAIKKKVVIEQSLPFCVWPKDFLEHLKESGSIFSGCHVFKRNGLIFSTRGDVLPCNCLHEIILGRYGNEFDDPASFESFWLDAQVVEFYNKLISYPSRRCMDCEDYMECGGGCPLQWFVFRPRDVIARRKKR